MALQKHTVWESVIRLVSMLFVLVFGLGMLYLAIDLVGTLNDWWTGNFISVAVKSGLEYTLLLSMKTGTAFFESFGFMHRTAEIITACIWLVVSLLWLVVAFCLWFKWRHAADTAAKIRKDSIDAQARR